MQSPLTSNLLIRAYGMGIFPMARSGDDSRLYWIDPDLRGVLPLNAFHVPKRLKRTLRHGGFTIKVDTAFEAVMQGCAEPKADRPDTWINSEIIRLFTELHHLGLAHSVETWAGDKLVGGLYGLAIGSAFFGESMFSRQTDASKVALVSLVARLRYAGFQLLDTQFVTDHLLRFGAKEISRDEYLRQLHEATQRPAVFPRDHVPWQLAIDEGLLACLPDPLHGQA